MASDEFMVWRSAKQRERSRWAFRVAVELLEHSRMGSAVLAAIRATTHSFGRVLHQLWLEVTGFMFLAIAAIGAMAGVREYGKYQFGPRDGPGPAGTCGMLHGFIRLVWCEFVLAGKAKSQS